METKSVYIPSIGCDGCVSTISNELMELPGVRWVDGKVHSKQVQISWEDSITWDQITTKLIDIGYPPSDSGSSSSD